MLLPLSLLLACTPNPSLPPDAAAAAPLALQPPVAEQREHVHHEHGVDRTDPYHWLRYRDDPAVMAYIQAENAYTDAVIEPLAPLQQQLYDGMLARVQETHSSPPFRHGDHLYYSRTEQGRSYEILCRKAPEEGAPEQVLLDENALAEGSDYFELGTWEPSPDHSLLAHTIDTAGDEIYRLQVKDLSSGELLPDLIEGCYWSVQWAADGQSLFYLTLDDALRPWRVYRHALGTDQADDVLVHQEDDERFHVHLGKTRSGAFITITMASTITTEVRVLPADQPAGSFELVAPRHHGMEYSIAHHGDRFWITTNDCDDDQGVHADCALNFHLVSAPTSSHSRDAWSPAIPHRPDVRLLGVEAFAGHLVLRERQEGLLRLRSWVPTTDASVSVTLPEDSYVLWREDNPEYASESYRFGYSSMVTPDSIFEAQLGTGALELLEELPVPGYDRSLYTTERLWVTARDGASVPMAIVHRSDLMLDGSNPALLFGYGAYGVSYDAEWDATALALLDRGFVVGIAQVRGGGDLGRPWYEAGKLEHKANSFHDFIDCAEHLVAAGYTAPERLAVSGTSAGGLLMGAVTNIRPDLFAVVLAHVPFVDVVSTMLDESIPLTAIEWEEWGDPRQPEPFATMLAYSPYDQVSAQAYPAMLVTSGLNDPRVQYWEPTKWVAKIRATGTGDAPLLLRTHMGAGHAGSSGRYGHLEDRALDYAFVLDVLGLGHEF
jgi:oligopeptidase B